MKSWDLSKASTILSEPGLLNRRASTVGEMGEFGVFFERFEAILGSTFGADLIAAKASVLSKTEKRVTRRVAALMYLDFKDMTLALLAILFLSTLIWVRGFLLPSGSTAGCSVTCGCGAIPARAILRIAVVALSYILKFSLRFWTVRRIASTMYANSSRLSSADMLSQKKIEQITKFFENYFL